MNKYIEHLFRIAPLMPFDSSIRSRHVAGIFDGKHCQIIDYNKRKSHPFQKKFGRNPDSICMHAEISVIRRASGIYVVRGMSNLTLAVIRYHPKHGLLPSKPCEGCMRCIVEFGIKHVYWS